jgi:hypothetical protein
MKFLKRGVFFCLLFFFSHTLIWAQSQEQQDADELIKLILEEQEGANNGVYANNYSSKGAVEFWSSGGLMVEIKPDGRDFSGGQQNLTRKHITIVSLVPGKAAVAYYYAEGSIKPKNAQAVDVYRTRVSQTFVKENGSWKIRSSHWSPIQGGAGTTQVSLD